MKSGKKIVTLVIMVFFISLGITGTVRAAGYTHEEGSNVYLIKQTEGDVTDAVKEAMEAADTSAAIQTIRLNPGTYQVGAIMINKSHLTLDLTGVTLESNGKANHMLRIADQSVSDIAIKGGTWNGQKKVQMVFFVSGRRGRISNLSIEDCNVSGGKETNVRLESVDDLLLDNVKIQGSGYGLLALECTKIKVQDCKAENNNFGLAFRSSNGTLTACKATENVTDGLQIKDEGTDIKVNGGSFCRNGKNGISLTSGASMTINGADVSFNKGNGISPVGVKGKNTIFIAADTDFSSNGRHGVAADIYVTVSMSDCTANNNAVNGVFLNTQSTAKQLKNIVAKGNGSAKGANGGCGILVQGGSDCKSIENAVCDNNGKLGISLEDVQTSVNSCSLNGNKKHGLFLSGKAKRTVTVNNCTINKNKVNGIMTSGKKTVDVKKTTIQGNGNCGVESKDCTIKVTGEDNRITKNKKHGVVCRGGKLMVEKAMVDNNKRYGLYFEGSSSGYCVNSTLEGNLAGIVLSQGAAVKKINRNTFTNNSKYNLMLYAGTGKKITTLKACNKNRFSVKNKNGMQVYFEKNTKVPSKLKATKGKAKKDGLGNTFAVKKK